MHRHDKTGDTPLHFPHWKSERSRLQTGRYRERGLGDFRPSTHDAPVVCFVSVSVGRQNEHRLGEITARRPSAW